MPEQLQDQADSAELIVASPPHLELRPRAKIEDLVGRLSVITGAMKHAMEEGTDYGRVGGSTKPTLLKPGAEKLSVLFELDLQPTFEVEREGLHLTVACHVVAYHAPTGTRLGAGRGVCSTRERKYAVREAKRVCPECHQATILESRKAGEEGFFCWRKKGGCGRSFGADDERITGQEIGEVENPDLPDFWNTVTKMSEKRAKVDAVLAVTGASAIFTQDAEDGTGGESEKGATEPPPRYGPGASSKQLAQAMLAIGYLLEVEPDDGRAQMVATKVTTDTGYFPAVAARAIIYVAQMHRKLEEPTPAEEEQRDEELPEAEIEGMP